MRHLLERFVPAIVWIAALCVPASPRQSVDDRAYEAYENDDLPRVIELLQPLVATGLSRGPRDELLAQRCALLSSACISLERFDSAFTFCEVALAISDSLGNKLEAGICLMNMGIIHKTRGDFDKARDAYERALPLCAGEWSNEASLHSNLGVLYKNWGRFDKALEHYHTALALCEKNGDKRGMISKHNNIAGIYHLIDKPYRVREHLDKSLALARELGVRRLEAIVVENSGRMFEERGVFDSASIAFRQALGVYRELSMAEGITMAQGALGRLFEKRRQFDSALVYLRSALTTARSYDGRPHIASELAQIGIVHWRRGEYGPAIDSLRAAVAILETLRTTAQGDIRRDYLSSQIEAYQWLASALHRAGRDSQVLDIVEQSSARYLAEQIGARALSADPARALAQWVRALPRTALALRYANEGAESGLMRVVVCGGATTITECATDSIRVPALTRQLADRSAIALRGIRVDSRQLSTPGTLAQAVEVYRRLLARPPADASALAATRELGRTLYDVLLGGLDSLLAEPREIVIAPDGVLGTLPFEALVCPDGTWLIEKHTVRYSYSLVADQLLSSAGRSKARKPLLAFGGALYAKPPAGATRGGELSEDQAAALAGRLRGASGAFDMSGVFSAAGLDAWEDLPGTRTEVQSLGALFRGADIRMGEQVSESAIAAMSKTGELAGYRAVHFATHGIVVPDLPELSSLVLSNAGTGVGGYDGYLMMAEVASLKLGADIVTLSACETGLGKLYGGEGVVGLSQAFLIAGARAVVSSLWQVADESTSRLTVDFYRGLDRGAAQALADVKRSFISAPNGTWSHPFYWAPFVVYGR